MIAGGNCIGIRKNGIGKTWRLKKGVMREKAREDAVLRKGGQVKHLQGKRGKRRERVKTKKCQLANVKKSRTLREGQKN